MESLLERERETLCTCESIYKVSAVLSSIHMPKNTRLQGLWGTAALAGVVATGLQAARYSSKCAELEGSKRHLKASLRESMSSFLDSMAIPHNVPTTVDRMVSKTVELGSALFATEGASRELEHLYYQYAMAMGILDVMQQRASDFLPEETRRCLAKVDALEIEVCENKKREKAALKDHPKSSTVQERAAEAHSTPTPLSIQRENARLVAELTRLEQEVKTLNESLENQIHVNGVRNGAIQLSEIQAKQQAAQIRSLEEERDLSSKFENLLWDQLCVVSATNDTLQPPLPSSDKIYNSLGTNNMVKTAQQNMQWKGRCMQCVQQQLEKLPINGNRVHSCFVNSLQDHIAFLLKKQHITSTRACLDQQQQHSYGASQKYA